jgi:hypothetical protein
MLRENVERRRVAWEQELVAGMRRDELEAFMAFSARFVRSSSRRLGAFAFSLRCVRRLWTSVWMTWPCGCVAIRHQFLARWRPIS